MEPAHSIIQRLGGPAAVSARLGTSYTAPYRWQHPLEKGGTGGLIPQKHHRSLLALAAELGVELSADDFLAPLEPAEAEAAA